ncbi:helix-turn-helix domain-containing protein [Bacillus tianshenii]|nr:helix-turn-helix domain-containing protein [Bacillus tianshenii]
MAKLLANADIAAYKRLSKFTTVNEFNETIRHQLYYIKNHLTKADIAVLNVLKRHAVKIIGVCFLKLDTLAALADVSRSSAERAVRKLEKLHVLERKATHRVNGEYKGGRGHNVYCFLSIDGSVDAGVLTDGKELSNRCAAKEKAPKNKVETAPCQTKPSKEKTLRSFDQLDELNEHFTPSFVPTDFKETAAPFFRSANKIVDLWSRAEWAHRRSKLDWPLEEMSVIVCDVFRQTVFAKKRGWIKKSFKGYFYHLLEQEFAVWRRREVVQAHPMYNWLES